MRVLILGCGYVGMEVGRLLVQAGHDVVGLRRSTADTEAITGLRLMAGDIADPSQLRALPGPFDWVINTVSSSRGSLAEYQRAFVEGTRAVVAWLKERPPAKYVYTSSTSVYGQVDGAWIDETSPTVPASATGQVLVETERRLFDAARAGFPAMILRVAGIYGPGRGHLYQQYLRDEARLSGGGERYLNMIHRDDVAGSIVRALEGGQAGECYNVSDDEPVTQLAFFSWLSEQLGKPLPPVETEPRERKRAETNKRVSNAKLKSALGYRLKYPTFREGYAEEIRRGKP